MITFNNINMFIIIIIIPVNNNAETYSVYQNIQKHF
jgi:hypothetical protein